LRREIPEALDTIVARAMNKELDQRYATWEDFAHDLAQAFRNKQLKLAERDFADSEKFDTLRSLPFFNDFSDIELWEVLRFSRWSQVPPAETILHDGDAGDFFCFVAEGELKVTKNGRILNLLTTGDCFGEMAVISKGGHPRGADVISLVETKLITIRGEALSKASEGCRMHFYQSFLEVLANRLALANARLSAF
jgi:signal-transduction protein with cAMP-binding, CBS, and nucleotidyltransferase domain